MNLSKYLVKEVKKDPKKGLQTIKLENGHIVNLKQSWYNSIIEVGDKISIYLKDNKFNDNQIITIDDKDGYLVLNSDHLITVTELSNLSYCARKTWLNSKFKITCPININILIGDLVHSLFEEKMMNKSLNEEDLFLKLHELVRSKNCIKYLVILNLEEQEIIKEVHKDYISTILGFFDKFGSEEPVIFDKTQPNLKLKIDRVTDIEDTIISADLGLKGSIDVRMDVELHDLKTGKIKKNKSIPFELKTGQVSFSYSHQAQINLYALMINNANFGLLAYLKGGVDMKYVESNNYIRNGLIQQRNDLVHYLKYLRTGPDTKTNISSCSKCEHLLDCCLMGKIYEPDKLNNFNKHQPDLVLNTLSHLNKVPKQLSELNVNLKIDNLYINFFTKWIEMIFVEEQCCRSKSKNHYWTKSSVELEKNLQSIARLSLYKIKEYSLEYVFTRSSNFKNLGPLPVDIQFNKLLDKITLSIEDENGNIEKIGFVNGVIKSIDENYVTVQLDDIIKDDFLNKLFRLDIYIYQVSFSLMYTSILRLMNRESNSRFLRDVIINSRRPTFHNPCNQQSKELQLFNDFTSKLNVCQRNAILKTLQMDDYLLIKGYPGSGKTETIVHMVRLLVELGKTVLITAHTNQAVDNILLKLLKYDVSFMRIGNLSRIDAQIIQYSEEYLIQQCTSKLDFQKLFNSVNVFASTCHSINSHVLFDHRIIEYCIIDEASQLSLPEALVPLFNVKKFILVGDPQQLPPIVHSDDAKKMNLDKTLFDILYENKYEESCVELTIQYRMNNEIMRIANEYTYDNKLICGSQTVANTTLNIMDDKNETIEISLDDSDSDIEIEIINTNWLNISLSPKLDLSVVFLNTDSKLNSEHQLDVNNEMYNQFEINIIIKIINELVAKNYNLNDVGIISPFNRQVKSIRNMARMYNVECSTIDQYQGRDKSIIIMSCVKNSKEITAKANDILNDRRRINVAITRSKHKLIMIGSKRTLLNYIPFMELFQTLKPIQILNI